MTTAIIEGVSARLVTIEHAECKRAGMVTLDHRGETERGAKEARVRCLASLVDAHPTHDVTVDARRIDPLMDLAVAVAMTGRDASGVLFLGELSLSGNILPVRGLTPALLTAADAGIQTAIVPIREHGEASAIEAILLHSGLSVLVASHVSEVLAYLDDVSELPSLAPYSPPLNTPPVPIDPIGMEGQQAQVLAAIEAHQSVLLVGCPGSGKTFLARWAARQIHLSADDQILVRSIYSSAGLLGSGGDRALTAPFRAPHHTASAVAMVGGGRRPVRPGEVTLAHGGMLFLDEVAEFRRDVIECLRVTLDRGCATVRLPDIVTMPADPRLVMGATNPCPCAWSGEPSRICTCAPDRTARYMERATRLGWDVIVEMPTATEMYGARCAAVGAR